ncbi:MAG: GNAT family N-acetyltransferase [Clostridia bacterium]|nr:GNAT family N-acetyltransferase [Clostridia bacterium]
MIEIKLAEKNDLSQCAEILRDIYNNNVLSEGWTIESSNSICEFYFKLNPDLFFVAKNEDEVVGFTFSYIKPWANGNQLMAEELSVKESYRKQKIASKLLKTLVETAKQKYNITCVNGTTYNGENKMPYSWYERIGFRKVEDLFLIESNPNDIINKIK